MKKFVIGILLLLGVGSVAFATLGGMRYLDDRGWRGSERQLRSRLVSYWDARVRGSVEDMAPFIHPAQTGMMLAGSLVTEAYEIQDLEIRDERAVATVMIRSRIKQAGFAGKSREKVIKDPWVRHEGTWFREPGPATFQDAIRQYRGEWKPEAAATPDAGSTPSPVAQ